MFLYLALRLIQIFKFLITKVFLPFSLSPFVMESFPFYIPSPPLILAFHVLIKELIFLIFVPSKPSWSLCG